MTQSECSNYSITLGKERLEVDENSDTESGCYDWGEDNFLEYYIATVEYACGSHLQEDDPAIGNLQCFCIIESSETHQWELVAPVAADMNTAVRSHSGWYRPEVCIDGVAGLHADRHDFVCLSSWENPDPTRTWLMVDHGTETLIGRVVITNDYRPGNTMEYINPWELYVGNVEDDPKANTLCARGTDPSEIITVDCESVISGRYLYLNLEGGNRRIHIRELQAYTAPTLSLETSLPTLLPSFSPTMDPTATPSHNPTINPSASPSYDPTSQPTVGPSDHPTLNPSQAPTTNPSLQPSMAPTQVSTKSPSVEPSEEPTTNSASLSTSIPSLQPMQEPTPKPTSEPSKPPSTSPTFIPMMSPSGQPSFAPNMDPTDEPSYNPTNEISVPSIAPITSAPTVIGVSTVQVTFAGNYDIVIRDQKEAFLQECTEEYASNNVKCSNVVSGSIIIFFQGQIADVNNVINSMVNSGELDLPSFTSISVSDDFVDAWNGRANAAPDVPAPENSSDDNNGSMTIIIIAAIAIVVLCMILFCGHNYCIRNKIAKEGVVDWNKEVNYDFRSETPTSGNQEEGEMNVDLELVEQDPVPTKRDAGLYADTPSNNLAVSSGYDANPRESESHVEYDFHGLYDMTKTATPEGVQSTGETGGSNMA